MAPAKKRAAAATTTTTTTPKTKKLKTANNSNSSHNNNNNPVVAAGSKKARMSTTTPAWTIQHDDNDEDNKQDTRESSHDTTHDEEQLNDDATPIQAPVTRVSKSGKLKYEPGTVLSDQGQLWFDEIDQALLNAIQLIPNIGRKTVQFNDQELGRNALLSEYILRHTGWFRSKRQIGSHLQLLKKHNANNSKVMELLRDHSIEDEKEFQQLQNDIVQIMGPMHPDPQIPQGFNVQAAHHELITDTPRAPRPKSISKHSKQTVHQINATPDSIKSKNAESSTTTKKPNRTLSPKDKDMKPVSIPFVANPKQSDGTRGTPVPFKMAEPLVSNQKKQVEQKESLSNTKKSKNKNNTTTKTNLKETNQIKDVFSNEFNHSKTNGNLEFCPPKPKQLVENVTSMVSNEISTVVKDRVNQIVQDLTKGAVDAAVASTPKINQDNNNSSTRKNQRRTTMNTTHSSNTKIKQDKDQRVVRKSVSNVNLRKSTTSDHNIDKMNTKSVGSHKRKRGVPDSTTQSNDQDEQDQQTSHKKQKTSKRLNRNSIETLESPKLSNSNTTINKKQQLRQQEEENVELSSGADQSIETDQSWLNKTKKSIFGLFGF
ncbi:hypothetical protein OIO90_003637 [Microbotryomycetes sp. JL221]|nr:hypothetical protein OIO90_003637 [Microbotryomycetes sp. JL221]